MERESRSEPLTAVCFVFGWAAATAAAAAAATIGPFQSIDHQVKAELLLLLLSTAFPSANPNTHLFLISIEINVSKRASGYILDALSLSLFRLFPSPRFFSLIFILFI